MARTAKDYAWWGESSNRPKAPLDVFGRSAMGDDELLLQTPPPCVRCRSWPGES